METPKTISSVLYFKFIDYLDNNKLSKVTTPIFMVIMAILLAFALSNIRLALETCKIALLFHDFILPKFIFSLLIIWNYRFVYECFKNVFALPVQKIEVDTFLGMEIQEIVDYILENKTFRREEFSKQFSIGRDTAEKLAKKLDAMNLFVRGENNARVLNAEFSPDDIYNIFKGKEMIEEISFVHKFMGNGTWETIAPS